jgi:hypothetical protein
MMQAASEIFLGWTTGLDERRHFYWRQLRDMKGSAVVAAYLGETDAFDRSITEFAQLYADRNEQDHEQFVTAVRSGRLQALEGV